MRQFFLFLIIAVIGLSARNKNLKVGDSSPINAVNTVKGAHIDLAELKDKKVLITFFRYAGCPICNYRVHELTEAFDSLTEAGFVLIGVFESSAETMSKYVTEYQVPFHVVANEDGSIYKKFSVPISITKTAKYSSKKRIRYFHKRGMEYYDGSVYKRDGKLLRSTADFVLDNGVFSLVSYNKVIGDHVPLKDL